MPNTPTSELITSTTKLVDKATTKLSEVESDAVSTFFSNLSYATDVLAAKLTNLAPEALELLLSLVWAKGVYSIVVGILYLLPIAFMYKFFKNTVIGWWKQDDGDAQMGVIICLIMYAATSTALAILSANLLLNFYTWLSVISPEGALALKALSAAGISL